MNWNTNIGFRVALLTFFEHRNCPAGLTPFRAEVKNGGARSWPRPEDPGRAYSNRPASWVRP